MTRSTASVRGSISTSFAPPSTGPAKPGAAGSTTQSELVASTHIPCAQTHAAPGSAPGCQAFQAASGTGAIAPPASSTPTETGTSADQRGKPTNVVPSCATASPDHCLGDVATSSSAL